MTAPDESSTDRLGAVRGASAKGASVRELQVVIEGLAAQLQRAVAIDDPKINLLAYTAHNEPVDDYRIQSIMKRDVSTDLKERFFDLGIRTAEVPMRIPGLPELGLLGRVCVPIRCQNVLLGFLWLIDDDDSLTEDELLECSKAAVAAGEILYRNQLIDDLRRARERELLLDLIDDDPAERAHVSEEALVAAGLDHSLSCRVVLFNAPGLDSDATSESAGLVMEAIMRKGLRKLPHTVSLVATRGGGWGYVLIAYRPIDEPIAKLRDVAQAVHREVLSSVPGAGDVLIAIGPHVPTLDDAALSFRRAKAALDVSAAVPEFGAVSTWDDLGVYQVLNQLPMDGLSEIAIPPGLRRLLTDGGDQWLVETLDVYLDAAGNVQESAKLLHIHRATLYYRLSRIEELTGMSLADGRDRLALHLGIKLARLLGEVPESATRPAKPASAAGE